MSLLPFLTAPGRLSAMLHPGMRLASSNAAQVMNGGAKPPVGTPPFSPPYPNTGGAEPPNRKGLAGFIDRVFNPTNALGQFGQALVASGNSPVSRAMAHMAQVAGQRRQAQAAFEQRQLERQEDWDDWQRKEQYKVDNLPPETFSGAEDRFRYDPKTGVTNLLYDAPTDAQDYARSLGLDPETPEGRKAMRDYVLRDDGPTALAGRRELETLRFGHRQKLRSTPTWGQLHPRAPGGLAPPTKSPRRARALSEGATATGPGGKKLILRGGKWVPM